MNWLLFLVIVIAILFCVVVCFSLRKNTNTNTNEDPCAWFYNEVCCRSKIERNIKCYRVDDSDCLPLIDEFYSLYAKTDRSVKIHALNFLSEIARLRLERFVYTRCSDNLSLLSSWPKVYDQYDEVKTDPKEHFERYFLTFVRHYNHVFMQDEDKEFIEKLFDVDAFLKDIEEVHKMYVKIITKV